MLNIGKAQNEGHTYRQFLFALLANTITLCYGFECGWISPITMLLQSELSPTGMPLSESAMTLVASSMSLAAIFGVPIFAYVTEKYGTKRAIILLAFPQALSWILRITYSSTVTIVAARILSGVAAGGIFNVIPMYVKEISQDEIRGVLGSLLVLTQNVGVFLMYLMGAYLEYYTVMQFVVLVPIIAAVLMTKAPESPAFLIKHGKIEEAAKTIASLRGLERENKIVENEIEYLRNENMLYKNLPDITMKTILKEKAWRRGLFLIIITFTFYSFNGAFAMVTYASTILTSTGVQLDMSPELQTLSIPLFMIIASLVLTLIIERFNRKVLVVGAFFITSISMAALGGGMLVQQQGGSVPGWLPVLAVMSTVTVYAGALSPMPYIIMTEMFNFQVLGKVMGSVVTYVWFATFVAVAIYSPISTALGQYTIYFIYGGANLLGAIFVAIWLPETKGKNSEEIRQEMNGTLKGDWRNST